MCRDPVCVSWCCGPNQGGAYRWTSARGEPGLRWRGASAKPSVAMCDGALMVPGQRIRAEPSWQGGHLANAP